ncbi:SMP-30/gluconolactonase/LRE family protein [Sphingorhabdus sp. M41]|uniref:SMP-30/gluconolactonase/LRE family protein n=1 Tax=Sphingorhabdus sp. M41 TaxID=1806885 RepID=UPI00078D75BC|nr:SMP-30/gluconolactonase/LRE family protein [Sphingorhabdus sp. M41]AMO70565.1 gluconolaconase [Sphingorhabdus sp. M41]
MTANSGRYDGPSPTSADAGWTVRRLTQPSRLMGANGLRTGADGRIYVAQVAGSQISAIDPDSGRIDTISGRDGPVIAPDDLAFDEDGNIYITEITEGRLTVLAPDGSHHILKGDMPVANPVTYQQGRLIAGECRPNGRVMEIDRSSGEARMILEGVPMPNAFSIGPDGLLYMPIMGANEIWRVSLDGGEPEVVAGDLGVPDSVKFDSKGYIISTQAASGQVLRIDPQSGSRELLAQLGPGLDNCTFVGDRLFVSSIPGEVTEILGGGKTRPLVERGLQWPTGLAMGTDGSLFVADGGFTYLLAPQGQLELLGFLFTPGFPGWVRGVCQGPDGNWIVSTSNGHVARWRTADGESDFLCEGLNNPCGIACRPDGVIHVAEIDGGRLLAVENGDTRELATGLSRPMGVAHDDSGACLIAESSAGRIIRVTEGGSETVVDGLGEPQGIAIHRNILYIADCGTKELIAFDLEKGLRTILARDLPLKAPKGMIPNRVGAVGTLSGPMDAFTGLACGADGTIYVSGDAEGSVLAVTPAV